MDIYDKEIENLRNYKIDFWQMLHSWLIWCDLSLLLGNLLYMYLYALIVIIARHLSIFRQTNLLLMSLKNTYKWKLDYPLTTDECMYILQKQNIYCISGKGIQPSYQILFELKEKCFFPEQNCSFPQLFLTLKDVPAMIVLHSAKMQF